MKVTFRQSLLARALVSNFALVGITVALLTGLFLLVQLRAIQTQMDLRAKVLIRFVAAQSDFAMLVGDRAELERIAHNALSIEDVLFVVLTDRSGQSIQVNRSGFSPDKVSTVDRHPRVFQIVEPVLARTGSSVMEWDKNTPFAEKLGTVRIGFSLERQQRLRTRTLFLSVPLVLVSLIVILAVQYVQLRRLLEPLTGLIAFVRGVAQGNRSLRAPVARQDEVGRLAEAFNRMVEELGSTTVSKDYINNIIRSMAESLIVVGADRTIRTVNQATLSMLGYSEDELIGRPAALILGGEKPLADGSAGAECVYRLKNGAAVPVLFSASAMMGENGACEGQVYLAQDITARKAAERELRDAKREAENANRAKSDLLSRTSHELRTPLNSILGFGQLLEFSELCQDDRESVERIMKAGRHLLALINEVLDIAGIEGGRRTISREPVQVSEAVYQALDMVGAHARTENIEIRVALEGWDCRYIWADRQRLQQVLLNLLSNAIKYNRTGGSVTLSCTPRDVLAPPSDQNGADTPAGSQSGADTPAGGQSGALTPAGTQSGALTPAGGQSAADTLRIAVTDTGPGIPPEGLAKLFVPFERLGAAETGIEGTGLGLAFSKIFVEAMGGSIGVESTVGQGTTFWLDMSLAAAPAGEPPRDPDSAAEAFDLVECGERVVLYIEDNPANLELVERLVLRYPAVHLISATRGDEGLRLARERRPDLILLDLHLPDIWGDEVLRRLRQDAGTYAIPVIILSADATGDQSERLLAAGAQRYLTKPLDWQELLRTMHSFLNTGRPVNV